MNAIAREIIAALRLEPLPDEGGFFRQTSRTATASAILYVLTTDDFSALHRIAQDELWHFHAGDPIDHMQLDRCDGSMRITRLGADVLGGDVPQVFVPAGAWQGARIAVGRASARSRHASAEEEQAEAAPYSRPAHGFALLGCTVSPPWDEAGFEPGSRDELLRNFPAHAAWIQALTR